MEFNGQIWFWMKVCVLLFYFLALLLKVGQCLRCFQGTGQGLPVVPEVPMTHINSQRSTILEEADKYESDVAYVAFTRLVAPFCMITTALSLLQDTEGIPSSLTFGGSNAFPLLISGILLLSEHRPQFRVRFRIWLALALWFFATQLSYLLARELRLDENMWLNHMVFVTMISMALQLPKLLTWTSAVLHSLAFLALTLIIGEEGGPSMGLQVYLFAVMLMSTHYANILSLTTIGRLKTELDCKEAKMKAQRCEIETAVAQALAHEETLRAQAAETDLLMARARMDALSAAHATVMNLLRSICDAVVQVDNDLNVLDSDKLSLLLYQNPALNLVGTSFKDLLSPMDSQQFQDDIRAVQDGGLMPILARLKGSYDTKIRVAIYVSVLPQADGEVRYFLGITEDEAKVEAPCPTPNVKSPITSNLSQVLQRLDPAVEKPDLEAALEEAALEEAEREDTLAEAPQAFVEEEQMQAMMSFLWTWPLASQDVQDACCDTHHILSQAAVVLQKLGKIPCSNNSSRSFSWQCPACKLMGFQCDKDHFDNVNSSCGRCVNWDQLY